MKPKSRQKILTSTSVFVVLDPQLHYLHMSSDCHISNTLINGGNFINNNFTLLCRSKVP